MARMKNSLLGGLSGKIANLVISSWKGIDYIRSRPGNYKDPKTPSQMRYRTGFGLSSQFVSTIKEFVKLSFKQYAIEKTEYNAAVGYNSKKAITGTYPNLQIDYPKALVSKGDLEAVEFPSITLINNLEVVAQWQDNSGEGSARTNDHVILLAFNQTQQTAIWSNGSFKRGDMTASLQLPDNYAGDIVHMYLVLATKNYSYYSNSTYLGVVDFI